jgi:hypothetical protein
MASWAWLDSLGPSGRSASGFVTVSVGAVEEVLMEGPVREEVEF